MVEDARNVGDNRKNYWQQVETLVSFFRQGRAGQWKVFEVQKTPDNRILFAMRQGISGQKGSQQQIVIQLSEQEMALLALKLMKLVQG